MECKIQSKKSVNDIPYPYTHKYLLFNKGNVWVKNYNLEFDMTMGSQDGMELSELVGLYLIPPH